MISSESLHQSISNFVYDVIPARGRTLLILGYVLKCGRHRMFKIYVLFKVIYACERDIFKTVSAIDFKLEKIFILSRGKTLLILGHLLKPRWPPPNFLKCML